MAGSGQGGGKSPLLWGVVIGVLVVGGVLASSSDLFPSARTAVGLPPASEPAGGGDPALSPADRQLQAKLQPVIGCINGLDVNLASLAGAYRDEVAYARGTLAGKKSMMLHIGLGPDFDLRRSDYLHADPVNDCAKDLERAVGLPPQVPELDAAASDYARILRTMPPVLAEAKPYYKQEDWKDDRFAKGEVVDAQLRPMFAGIERAGDAMRAASRKQEDGLRGRQLAAVETRDGQGVRWQSLNVIARARDVQNEADRQAKAGQFSAKALQLAIEQFGTAWDGANAYAAGHPEMTRETRNGRRSTWSRISEPASNYLGSAKTLRRAMEGGADRDKLRSDYRSMLGSFNSFVDTVNSEF